MQSGPETFRTIRSAPVRIRLLPERVPLTPPEGGAGPNPAARGRLRVGNQGFRLHAGAVRQHESGGSRTQG